MKENSISYRRVFLICLPLVFVWNIACTPRPEMGVTKDVEGRIVPVEWSAYALPAPTEIGPEIGGIQFDTLYIYPQTRYPDLSFWRFFPNGRIAEWWYSHRDGRSVDGLQKTDGEKLQRCRVGRFKVEKGEIFIEFLNAREAGGWEFRRYQGKIQSDGRLMVTELADGLLCPLFNRLEFTPRKVGEMEGSAEW